MKVSSSINLGNLKKISEHEARALIKTADVVKGKLQESQTMPFETGALQNRSTFVDDSNVNQDTVKIVSDTPYARRLYFHPEYNFSKDGNPHAGGEWFEPYINGNKREDVIKTFERFAKL